MSVFQFAVSMILPAWVFVYTFNFSLWLWRRRDRMGAVGGWLLAAISGFGSLAYFMLKLFA